MVPLFNRPRPIVKSGAEKPQRGANNRHWQKQFFSAKSDFVS
jgi:hypothetical protein